MSRGRSAVAESVQNQIKTISADLQSQSVIGTLVRYKPTMTGSQLLSTVLPRTHQGDSVRARRVVAAGTVPRSAYTALYKTLRCPHDSNCTHAAPGTGLPLRSLQCGPTGLTSQQPPSHHSCLARRGVLVEGPSSWSPFSPTSPTSHTCGRTWYAVRHARCRPAKSRPQPHGMVCTALSSRAMFFWCDSSVPPPISSSFASRQSRSTTYSPM